MSEMEKDDGTEEYEVVELEAEDGTLEELLVINELEHEGATYALMAPLEEVETMETMTEAEFNEVYGDDGFMFLMRRDGEHFIELTEEESKSLRTEMDRLMTHDETP